MKSVDELSALNESAALNEARSNFNVDSPPGEDVIDSRDLIEYKEEVETELVDMYNSLKDDDNEAVDIDDVDFKDKDFKKKFKSEIKEYEDLMSFIEDLEGSPDFEYGEAIINDDYFTDYMEEMLRDTDYETMNVLDNLPSYFAVEIDWEETASNLQVDYMSANWGREEYWIRA